MNDRDDTLDTSHQGNENRLMALVDAGAMPGVAPVDQEGLQAIPGDSLVFYRVPRQIVEMGALAGAEVAAAVLVVGQQHHGHVALAFDGWADDPRPLAYVPQVVRFCAGLLLGDRLDDATHAQHVLRVLLDEAPLIAADADALDAAGSCWLVAHAWAGDCFARVAQSPTGFGRDHLRSLWLRDALRAGYIAPRAGEVAR